MRVCRLVWDFPKASRLAYGLGPTFYHISKEQVRLGLDVHVIARKRYDEPPYEEIEGVKVHRVKPPYNVNAIEKLRKLSEGIGIDIIHAHGTCGISYPLYRKKIGKPLIVHTHGTTLGMRKYAFPLPSKFLKESIKSKIREQISIFRQRYFWRSADMLIAVSNALKEELETLYGIKGEKIRVVYNGVDTSIFKPKKKEAQEFKKKLQLENRRVILFVGHFVLRKGIPYLIEAMPKVLREIPDAFLLCVGGTPKWLGTDVYWFVLEDMIKKRSLQNHVRLMGQVPHLRLPYYYSLSEAFVFPSLYEAFAKVLSEAMACETPVIASKAGGMPEIIENNVNGILIEPKNVKQLADAIIRVLQDKTLAQKIGVKGRQTVITRFAWHHTARALLEAYQEALKSH